MVKSLSLSAHTGHALFLPAMSVCDSVRVHQLIQQSHCCTWLTPQNQQDTPAIRRCVNAHYAASPPTQFYSTTASHKQALSQQMAKKPSQKLSRAP